MRANQRPRGNVILDLRMRNPHIATFISEIIKSMTSVKENSGAQHIADSHQIPPIYNPNAQFLLLRLSAHGKEPRPWLSITHSQQTPGHVHVQTRRTLLAVPIHRCPLYSCWLSSAISFISLLLLSCFLYLALLL